MVKGGIMKYNVVLEVDVKEDWCSVEDFTREEVRAFNNANHPMIKVEVDSVEEIKPLRRY